MDIRHEIKINSPADVVYRALTTSEGIGGWWTPDNRIDPGIGSVAEFNFGHRYHNRMEITGLYENKRVTWYCLQGDEEWVGTDFSFELGEKNGLTTLKFGHNNWRKKTGFFESCSIQWAKYMQSLKSYCEKGKGQPYGSNPGAIK